MRELQSSCVGAFPFGVGKVVDTIGHGLHNVEGSIVREFCMSEAFRGFIAQFGMRAPTVCMSKAILKPAKAGSKVPPHTDDQYFWTNPPSGLTLWFALDDADESNGCIQIVPNSHKTYLPGDRFSFSKADGKAHWLPPISSSFSSAEIESAHHQRVEFPQGKAADKLEWTSLPVPSGSLIVMDRRLVHRSASNPSQKSRLAFTIHIIDGACDFSEGNWIPREALLKIY